jgi:anti-sigma factor RsiW
MKLCEDYELAISCYVDQELDPGEYSTLFGHLSTCGRCAEFMGRIIEIRIEAAKEQGSTVTRRGPELNQVQPTAEELRSLSYNPVGAGNFNLPSLRDQAGWKRQPPARHNRFRVFALVAITVLVSGLIWTKTLPRQTEEHVDLTRDTSQSEMPFHQR